MALATVAAIPACFDSLSAVEQDDLYRRIAALEADLRARLLTRQLPQAVTGPPGTLLRIKDACNRMDWHYSWAYKHWRELGGFKDLDGGLKIRADVLAKHGQPAA
jgi:hypothetical protein